jgi:hypothetical protein
MLRELRAVAQQRAQIAQQRRLGGVTGVPALRARDLVDAEPGLAARARVQLQAWL